MYASKKLEIVYIGRIPGDDLYSHRGISFEIYQIYGK